MTMKIGKRPAGHVESPELAVRCFEKGMNVIGHAAAIRLLLSGASSYVESVQRGFSLGGDSSRSTRCREEQ